MLFCGDGLDFSFLRSVGPAASVSAGPGAIVRVHCVFYDPNIQPKQWRQTSAHQVNLLEDVHKHFPVKNGYINLTGSEPKFPKTRDKDFYKLLGKVEARYSLPCICLDLLFLIVCCRLAIIRTSKSRVAIGQQPWRRSLTRISRSIKSFALLSISCRCALHLLDRSLSFTDSIDD